MERVTYPGDDSGSDEPERAEHAGAGAPHASASGPRRRVVIRMPKVTILAACLVIVCATPMALAAPVLTVLYALPIGFIVWLLRTQTVADDTGITVRTTFTTRFLPWSGLGGLSLTRQSTVRAVLTDGTEVALPSVRTRHLPVLSLVSGGLIEDPTAHRPERTGSGSNA